MRSGKNSVGVVFGGGSVTGEKLKCADAARNGSPSDACLERALSHVRHDLYLLRLSWDQKDERVAQSLWFVMARSLSQFFIHEERAGDKDDILATDFVKWDTPRKLANRVQEVANKRVARLRTPESMRAD